MRRGGFARPLVLTLGFLYIGAASAADWHLAPVVALNGEYNSNALLTAQGAQSASGGFLDLSLPLQASTERLQFLAALDGRVFRYNDSYLNRNDGRLDLSLKETWEKSALGASANFTRDTTLTSELGTTGLTYVNKTHTHYDVSLSPQFEISERGELNFDLRGQRNRYEDAAQNGLVDYDYVSALAGYKNRTTEATSIGLALQGSRLLVPGQGALDSSNSVLRFTLSHRFTERLSLDGYLGPTLTRQQGLRKWGGSGQLSLTYVGVRADFSLQVGRQLAPTGYGQLTTSDSLAASMTYRMTELLSSVTTVSYLRSNYLTTTSQFVLIGNQVFSELFLIGYDVYDWRVDQNFAWQWTETVALTLGLSETRQVVNLGSNNANRFTANLGLRWVPHRLF